MVKNPKQLDFILVSDFEVHRHGCPDIKRAIKNKVTEYTEAAVIDISETDTYFDVVRFLYDDQIREAYDRATDPDPENAIHHPEVADGDNSSEEFYEPSDAWLVEHGYVTAVHFNPCIKQWVTVSEQECEGKGSEWQSAEGLKTSTALECPTCHTTAGEMGLTPRKRNGKWRPLVPGHMIEVEEVRTPQSPASVPATTSGNGKAEAKRLLATMVAQAIAKMLTELADVNLAGDDQESADYRFIAQHFSSEEAAITAATWVHHIPADRDRWVAMGLPKPDRSDWR